MRTERLHRYRLFSEAVAGCKRFEVFSQTIRLVYEGPNLRVGDGPAVSGAQYFDCPTHYLDVDLPLFVVFWVDP